MSFADRIVQWQPFFITVATLSGTLVGLLFISLSINREAITANRTLLRLARRSFSDFIFILLISLFFLIPLQGGFHLGIELWAIGVLKTKLMFQQMLELSGGGQKLSWWDLTCEYVLPVLSTAGLAIGGWRIYQESLLGVYYFVVPVIATLLATACSNAWRLLIMEK
ncbi:MAG: hypothetical protein ACREDQ_13155 [Limisphaerales bacterium]